jgi:hypothetical protein
MDIKEVIATINQMQADGIIEHYAIGGAVAATFYLEPVDTMDVDIFVPFQSEPQNLIVSPQRILDYLTSHGCALEGEYVVIAGWPVQFLPAAGSLLEEALVEAVTVDVDGTPARVFTAEHLAAVTLQVSRAKDKARLLQFIEGGVLDTDRFQAILRRHALVDRWGKFEQQFRIEWS